MLLTYGIGWLGMVAIAILNGAMREKVYGSHLRELSAHQLSTLIMLFFLGLYIGGFTLAFPPESSQQALALGSLWVAMTIAFEFLFGHYLMGHSWSRLFQDYNLFKGRVWCLVLIWTGFAPYVFYHLRH